MVRATQDKMPIIRTREREPIADVGPTWFAKLDLGQLHYAWEGERKREREREKERRAREIESEIAGQQN